MMALETSGKLVAPAKLEKKRFVKPIIIIDNTIPSTQETDLNLAIYLGPLAPFKAS